MLLPSGIPVIRAQETKAQREARVTAAQILRLVLHRSEHDAVEAAAHRLGNRLVKGDKKTVTVHLPPPARRAPGRTFKSRHTSKTCTCGGQEC